VAVVGATASGKTELSLDLAERLGGEIVNTDAMQQYAGMDVGTAKLPVAERRGIAHHLLDVLDVRESASVAVFQQQARALIAELRGRGVTPVLVGGSALYTRAVLDRFDFPGTDDGVRARWESELARLGGPALHAVLAEHDPEAAAGILPDNGRRIVRALEVVELTGQPFAASAPVIGAPRWDTAIIGLDTDTVLLDERLTRRTDKMFDDGLVDEVRALLGAGLRDGVTAARALGYAQVIADLDEGGDGSAAREPTFFGTRRYVRRQRSWFRRDHRITWLDGSAPDNVERTLQVWRHVS